MPLCAVHLHLVYVNLCAGKATPKASLEGTAKGVDLDVRPSAPTSVPLRVRFGTGSPTGTVINPMFAQDGTASRYTSPVLLLLLGSVCCFLFFSIFDWSLVPYSCLLFVLTELPACLSNTPMIAQTATAQNL